MATPPSGPQHSFRRAAEGEVAPRQADAALIGRLLATEPESVVTVPAGAPADPSVEVVLPVAEEHGDLQPPLDPATPSGPQVHRRVSLPVDHRRSARVIRLYERHVDRPLTETDKFAHWRRWMAESKRKEPAR